jgi:hypothetical protein
VNHATCIITNCRNRAPATEPFCAKHREGTKMTETIHPAPEGFTEDQLKDDPILRYFHFAHLPSSLQVTSIKFYELACYMIVVLPRNAERSVALRKLLEAKDAAVRANVT